MLALLGAAGLLPLTAGAQPLPKVRISPPASLTALLPGLEVPPPYVTLSADTVTSRINVDADAQGHAELKRLDTTLTAERLRYDQQTARARAEGGLRVLRGKDWFTGSSADLDVNTSIGEILQADYALGRTGAGGRAARIELLGRERMAAIDASYSSCPRDDQGQADWVLTGTRIDIDNTRNEGRADGAVLRFLGVPLLALPAMSFPVNGERKSGWLPPTGDFDNRSGLQVAVPYYANLAPDHDLTITPQVMTKRGFALGTELRYLQQHDLGQATLYGLPSDQVFGSSRGSLQWAHDGDRLDGALHYEARLQRVSDDVYWKDFPKQLPSLTQRLLPLDLSATGRLPLGQVPGLGGLGGQGVSGDIETYARVQRWQTLQDLTATITVPFQRTPQVGARLNALLGPGLQTQVEAEANRFDLSDATAADTRRGGLRAHVTGSVNREFATSWGRFDPRLSVNAAEWHTDKTMADGRNTAARIVPTFSADSQLAFERDTEIFGRSSRQTLEPRLLYVLTPYRRQDTLPLWDTAAKDFNTASIFSDSPFTGIDRIADANQVTIGATDRYNDLRDGRELLRLGIAQRLQFRDQRVTPDGEPVKQRFSDLLLWGSSQLVTNWSFDGTVQYSAANQQAARAILSTRYHPGPFQTISATYRYARGSSEQYELGWQWPVYRRDGASRASSGCGGTLYAVGRVNYSVPDSRVTYSVAGLEYDAGCWVGRLVVERQSTGRNETNTHLMLQLELVGLSSLGAGSLKVLKDNIPGYQLLRDESLSAPAQPKTP